MTEQDRLAIVDKINEDLKLLNLLNQKKEEIKQLEKNEVVKEYLKILNHVSLLNDMTKEIITEEDAAHHEFNMVLNDMVRKKDFPCCEHDIWVYYGTWGMRFNNNCCTPSFIEVENERDNNFSFNKYMCLECGKEIKISDWKDFENNHIVLKDGNGLTSDCLKKYFKYQYLYFQLLYKYPVQEANDLLVKEFYNSKRNSKRKIRK